MKLPKIDLAIADAAGTGQSRSVFNSILAFTPVVLTILATILAGLSSSEMTLAQYYRALAAQYQSKVSDQWNFFQAKRIRGTEVQRTARLVQALSEPAEFQPRSLSRAGEDLLRDLRRAEKEAARLLDLMRAAKTSVEPAGPLLAVGQELQQVIAAKIKQVKGIQERWVQQMSRGEIEKTFAYLTGKKLPQGGPPLVIDPGIEKAARAIQARRPDSEVTPLISSLSDTALRQAIEAAEDRVQAIEAVNKPVSQAVQQLGLFVQEEVGAARSFLRAVRNVTTVTADLPAGDAKPLAELRQVAAALGRSADAVRASAGQLSADFLAAEDGYTALRYEREARANEETAAMYEVQVRKSAFTSERHRARSKSFFYGMLAAQAGVTVASFALAVKHRNLLWSLATLAGLGAVLFGVYVYLYM
jgi:hypothetical protein